MSLFSSIVNKVKDVAKAAVLDAQGPIGGLVSAIKYPLENLAGAAVALGGAMAGGAAGGAAAAANAGESTAANTTASLLGGIGDIVSSIKDTVSGFLGPIADTIHSVTNLVQDINENLLKPIVGPIQTIEKQYATLVDELRSDLKGGLDGLLRIPQDLTNALTSVDASLQRGLSMLGGSIGTQFDQTFNRSMPKAGSEGFDALVKSGQRTTDVGQGGEPAPLIRLREGSDAARISEYIAKFKTMLDKSEGSWWSPFYHLVSVLVEAAPFLVGYLGAFEEEARAYGKAAYRATHLDPSTALTAHDREIIDIESLKSELGFAGYSEERIQALLDLSDRLPGIGDALLWWHRDLIDDATLDRILTHNSVPDAQKAWYKTASLQPPKIADMIYNEDRRVAVTRYGAPASLSSPAPPLVLEAARANGFNVALAQTAWENHWVLISADDGCQAYFRGYINRDQLNAIFAFNSIPHEQWDLYLDLRRPEIPTITFPTLVSENIIDDNQARELMRRRGMIDDEINLFIKRAHATQKGATATGDQALHGLTQGVVLSLYDAGTIDTATATDLLQSLGFGDQAATLALQVRDLQNQVVERKAEADLVLARNQAGEFTYDEAQAALARLGLTATEVAKAMATLDKQQLTKTKLPGESSIIGMYKAGILARGEAAQALTMIGYSPGWAELLLQLSEKGGHGTTSNA